MADSTILFLCPHGAAKSVLAAMYFQQSVTARGLPFRADFAGTDPDDVIMPSVVTFLAEAGIEVRAFRPRLVTRDDLVGAHHVVSLGCPVGDLLFAPASVETWNDIPLVSQNTPLAAEIIHAHVKALVNRLTVYP